MPNDAFSLFVGVGADVALMKEFVIKFVILLLGCVSKFVGVDVPLNNCCCAADSCAAEAFRVLIALIASSGFE